MKIGEKFVKNDFFKDFKQKWEVRDGAVDFFRRFLSSDGFFNGGFTIAVFRPRGTMPVVRDVLMSW